jgi:hypothetical protein
MFHFKDVARKTKRPPQGTFQEFSEKGKIPSQTVKFAEYALKHNYSVIQKKPVVKAVSIPIVPN